MLANVKLLLHDNSPFLSLIVLCVNFKIALGMVAGGANLRGLLAHDDVTAVAALPHLDLALGEDLRHLHIVQQGTVALLVMLFNGGDRRKRWASSWKPSSSAVLAKPSYISVHS